MPPRRQPQRPDTAASAKQFTSSSTSTTDMTALPAKRKASDDSDSDHVPTRKKPKQSKPKSTAKPMNGEQVAGGLFIVRGAPTFASVPAAVPTVPPDLPPPKERRPARRSSPPPTGLKDPTPARPARKAANSKKPATTTTTTGRARTGASSSSAVAPAKSSKAKGKQRMTETDEANEEVRKMEKELKDLTAVGREQARRAGPSSPRADLQFAPRKSYALPPPPSPSTYRPPPAPSHNFLDATGDGSQDSIQALPIRDTPMISKNREMRKEANERRRTSLGMRGRRTSGASSDASISHPHTSIPHETFYKHMAAEDPPAMRMRNLLFWCSSRAGQSAPTPSPPVRASKRIKDKKTTSSDHTLPELSPDADRLLREVQDEVQRLLVGNEIDTSVFAQGAPVGAGGKKLRPNEQNVRNREKEKADQAYIERFRQEDEAWSALIQTYNTHQSTVLKSVATQMAKREGETSWKPRLDDLDERGRKAAAAAEAELREEVDEEEQELVDKFASLQVKVDTLHHSAHILSQLSSRAETHLASHLVTLQSLHRARTAPLPTPSTSNPSAPLSSLLASVRPDARSTTTGGQDDPQLLLRALAGKDVERQRKEEAAVGEEGKQRRREREGVAERRVTAVPPTPRRGQGTPGRPRTPAKGR